MSCHNKIIKNTVSAEFYLFAVGKNRCGRTNSTSTNRKSESHKYYTHIQFTPRKRVLESYKATSFTHFKGPDWTCSISWIGFFLCFKNELANVWTENAEGEEDISTLTVRERKKKSLIYKTVRSWSNRLPFEMYTGW